MTKLLPSTLSDARIESIEARMRPGNSSYSGFLDASERLREVVQRDEAVCQMAGVLPEQIADRIESIVGKAYRLADLACRGRIRLPEGAVRGFTQADGIGIVVDDQFRVLGLESRGLQGCPFENERGEPCGGGTYAFAEFGIENLRHDKRHVRHTGSSQSRPCTVEFPGLAIHLIRDHHFFEGAVRHRLDPQQVIDVLEIEASVNYAPQYLTEVLWQISEGTGELYESLQPWHREHFGRCMTEPDLVVDVADGVRIYVKGDTCSVIADRGHSLFEPLVIQGVEWANATIRPGTWVFNRIETRYIATP